MELTHFDDLGNANMVDTTEKQVTKRMATATGEIHLNREAMNAILQKTVKKGDVLGVARVAGIMAVKQNANLIPLCHTIPLTGTEISFEIREEDCIVKALCTVKCEWKTGVEMEALTGVSVALLTIYDMCKAIDKEMEITNISLLEKQGGKSGHYERKTEAN